MVWPLLAQRGMLTILSGSIQGTLTAQCTVLILQCIALHLVAQQSQKLPNNEVHSICIALHYRAFALQSMLHFPMAMQQRQSTESLGELQTRKPEGRVNLGWMKLLSAMKI